MQSIRMNVLGGASAALLGLATGAFAAQPPAATAQPGATDTPSPAAAHRERAERAAKQREALSKLARFDGEWRGSATYRTPSGETYRMVQTERVGPMLDGAIRVIEGRGHGPDGKLVFNAFAIVSYDPQTKAYTMRSYAGGEANDFPLRVIDDGIEWEIPGGTATTRYRATVRDGRWEEIGERLVAGQPAQPFFEMTLERLGDSDWPAGGAVGPE